MDQLPLFDSPVGSAKEIPLGQVMVDFDVVEVHRDPDYIVVAEKKPIQLSNGQNVDSIPTSDLMGLSTAYPGLFTSAIRQEYNSELRGTLGLINYDKMRKSDATIRAALRMYKIPVLSARWFMEPYSESKIDRNIAEFAWKCLTEYMSIPWSQVLYESLLMLEFGHSMLQKVWEFRVINGTERVVWKKLAPLHPMDVKEWLVDDTGGPRGVVVYPPTSQPVGFQEETIPIEKLAVFSFDREAGNIEGISLLRSVYQNWYYKQQLYKIDGIQKERHGIGVPIIKLPINFNAQDRNLADEIGRNLRTNERAHVVLPPNWEILFAKLEGQPVNVLESIEHHNQQIAVNILAPFTGVDMHDQDEQMFLKSSRYVADIVRETFNKYCIPQLVDYNFIRVSGYPKLRVRRIGETADWRTLSFAIRNLVGSKILTPDERLEVALRDEMDLPPIDFETIREVATPQAPAAPPKEARVGPPRQNPEPNVKPPAANAGTDKSGG